MQEILLANKGKFNFDHPDAFDNELMENCLAEILAGRSAKVLVVLYRDIYYAKYYGKGGGRGGKWSAGGKNRS